MCVCPVLSLIDWNNVFIIIIIKQLYFFAPFDFSQSISMSPHAVLVYFTQGSVQLTSLFSHGIRKQTPRQYSPLNSISMTLNNVLPAYSYLLLIHRLHITIVSRKLHMAQITCMNVSVKHQLKQLQQDRATHRH